MNRSADMSLHICVVSFAREGLLIDAIKNLVAPSLVVLLLLLAVVSVVTLVPQVQELYRLKSTLLRKGAFSLRFQKASLLYKRMFLCEFRQVILHRPSASWELRSCTPDLCLGGRISRWAVSYTSYSTIP